jgi:hypothetical protein
MEKEYRIKRLEATEGNTNGLVETERVQRGYREDYCYVQKRIINNEYGVGWYVATNLQRKMYRYGKTVKGTV